VKNLSICDVDNKKLVENLSTGLFLGEIYSNGLGNIKGNDAPFERRIAWLPEKFAVLNKSFYNE
jgi:hypothetical protein